MSERNLPNFNTNIKKVLVEISKNPSAKLTADAKETITNFIVHIARRIVEMNDADKTGSLSMANVRQSVLKMVPGNYGKQVVKQEGLTNCIDLKKVKSLLNAFLPAKARLESGVVNYVSCIIERILLELLDIAYVNAFSDGRAIVAELDIFSAFSNNRHLEAISVR